ncbi:Zn(2)-C6 fungal-type DNA-binding domain protein [Cordyceps fumosorosea ARSEF 2679]|uniref:Zn(2)-C6 fungal-type DNA-binding domain protein n=1 Tax=Cordyceps fumosorosea (strain ARSEF 2679) TaxID=1081104 RepID=A0A168E4G2_CORFA|nr:Zn(2)-C6 fungal-type DNA-binding domain protein [Cordyceps fumosorosea ARSEF 2679]OAA73366.1 Zn(2)-C6 fungal-type DNA-binding domain protein [Cordyceps fumosorosea ARSEF 2679]
MLGPLDRRRKRSRCQRCASSHLKCSGATPCSNCSNKDKPCIYAAATSTDIPLIIIASGKPGRPATSLAARRRAPVASPWPSPGLDDERYFYYFDVFARRNSFSGKGRLFTQDVKRMAELHALPYFLDSVRALGAIQASRLSLSSSTHAVDTYTSYTLYSQAVSGLRNSLGKQRETMSASSRTALLWTTLFLGMFELMSDTSGMGWLQHMVHGTAKGLAAAGPSICSTPAGARMFLQAKMFEVCRTIVFNDQTFLTRPEWRAASQRLWFDAGFADEWRPLDALVDLMLLCPDLRYRANRFCLAEDAKPSEGVPEEARDIANTGMALREALTAWHAVHLGLEEARGGDAYAEGDDECGLLTRLFWAAISIYLSGEFDYEMHHWRRFGLAVPTLAPGAVRQHVETILALSGRALAGGHLSPLLLLFPLRIAGARSLQAPRAQRTRVLLLLDTVAERFAAGQAVRDGLMEAWVGMGVEDN